MRLYYGPGLCSQAPHIALREAGLAFELVKVDLAAQRTEDDRDFHAISPAGYVPALEIEPGVVLTEGPAILQYIADHAPASGLAPAHGSFERYRLQSWLNFVTSELHKGYSPLFKPDTPAEYKQQALALLAQRLAIVERALAATPFLTGKEFTIADAYLFVVSGWSGFVGLDLAPFPNLVAFRARVAARPMVKAALAAEGLAR
ncbi:glutathione transferase GstA [Dokdonella fugitiva]|jgi:glutathione S-transferase|uniref:Glutathione S-transferase n=1 Tax=Dokdonella fugitiva TaxID=328517 RepID=A0A4R2ICH6_9GAMM|nr:glutathione transferase GstA [Dokdonella fugitiva]MBA8883969.1 glutathione S-transferase [Dokdonella fugitiva]TCO41957.1 glutathione S-transferase [Dokdonella fugitiva]